MWENMQYRTKRESMQRAHGTVATGKQRAMIPTTKIQAKTMGGHGKMNFGGRWTMMALTNAFFATEKLQRKKAEPNSVGDKHKLMLIMLVDGEKWRAH